MRLRTGATTVSPSSISSYKLLRVTKVSADVIAKTSQLMSATEVPPLGPSVRMIVISPSVRIATVETVIGVRLQTAVWILGLSAQII